MSGAHRGKYITISVPNFDKAAKVLADAITLRGRPEDAISAILAAVREDLAPTLNAVADNVTRLDALEAGPVYDEPPEDGTTTVGPDALAEDGSHSVEPDDLAEVGVPKDETGTVDGSYNEAPDPWEPTIENLGGIAGQDWWYVVSRVRPRLEAYYRLLHEQNQDLIEENHRLRESFSDLRMLLAEYKEILAVA
jgi:hypothetical protein